MRAEVLLHGDPARGVAVLIEGGDALPLETGRSIPTRITGLDGVAQIDDAGLRLGADAEDEQRGDGGTGQDGVLHGCNGRRGARLN